MISTQTALAIQAARDSIANEPASYKFPDNRRLTFFELPHIAPVFKAWQARLVELLNER